MMTDSHLDAQSLPTAVLPGPAWDLLATEVSFPIRVESHGKEYEVYAVLRQPYDADDLITAINLNRGGYRRTPAALENFIGDDQAFAKLTDKLFIRLDGTSTDDPTVQRQFLDSNFKLKVRLSREGFGGVLIDRTPFGTDVPPEEAQRLELLPLAIDGASDVTIGLHQNLWDPQTQKKVDVRMQHVLRPETEKDWRKWARTANERFTKANTAWTEAVNWWARVELYDQMIKRVDGMQVGQMTCNEAAKNQWLTRIPVWHKLLVIGEVFDEAKVKN